MKQQHLARRQPERRELMRVLDSKRPGLVIIRGSTGLGKTALMLDVLASRRHVYFRAAPLTGSDNRALLWREIERLIRKPLADELPDWDQQIGVLGELSERDLPGLTLVIDDYDVLHEADPEIAQVIAQAMDSLRKRSSPLHLVLCGTDDRTMKGLTETRGAFHGMGAINLEIDPLMYRDACGFLQGWSARDAIRGYSVFGGVPGRLSLVDTERSLKDTIIKHVLSEDGVLRDKPLDLLSGEFRSVHRYGSVLRAIAAGAELYSEILDRIPELTTPADLGPYLRKLQDLGWIRREIPLGSSAGRARNARYSIDDPFIGFWFAAVLPARGRLADHIAEAVHDEDVAPRLEQHVARVYQRLCRAYVERHADERLGSSARSVGEWWNTDVRIPVIGTLRDGSVIYGACDWSGQADPGEVLGRLRAAVKASNHARSSRVRHLVWFSPEEPSPDLLTSDDRAERVHWIGLEDLLGWPEGDD